MGLTLYIVVPISFLAAFIFLSNSLIGLMEPVTEELKKNVSPEIIGIFHKDNPTDGAGHVHENNTPQEIVIGDTFDVDLLKRIHAMDSDINSIPNSFNDSSIRAEDILSDRYNRISDSFKVPQSLRPRVAFWFDIYTRYTSRFAIIHDIDRPWIIYKVVDNRELYEGKGNRWAKHAKEKKVIKAAEKEVRRTLRRLSRRKNFKKLSATESRYYELLREVPGSRRRVLRKAAKNFRTQIGQKNYMRQGIAWSSKYMTEMEEIFAHYDLPVELVRLPLVESSFNEKARSKVGASGVWQLMPVTGGKFLKVGQTIDERNSPIKATDAAAKLMISNFKILKSWPLTITAYNHGAGGLIKARRKLKTRDISVIIKKHKSKTFGFASKNFYAEFLGALYAEKYQHEIFGELAKHLPLPAEEIELRNSIRIKTISKLLKLTMEEIKLYNPDLRSRKLSKNSRLFKGYKMRVPEGKAKILKAYFQTKVAKRKSMMKF